MKIQVTRELVALAKHVISKDPTRASLGLIYVQRFNDESGIAIATDSTFLLRIPVELLNNKDKRVLIDPSMLIKMSKLIPLNDINKSYGVIDAGDEENLQSLTVGNIVINSDVYPGAIYPDTSQVFPLKNQEDFVAINLGVKLLKSLLKTIEDMGSSILEPNITIYVSNNPKMAMPVVIYDTAVEVKGRVDGLIMPVNVEHADTTFPVGGRKK